MSPTPTLLAFALVSLPFAAQAQTLTTASARAHAAPEVRVQSPQNLSAVVRLTRPGVHASVAEALADGLEAVDTQMVDVDGDGDEDALVLVDLASNDEPKPGLGRGVVVAFRERHGWRAQTVASVQGLPIEAGYNWGPVEAVGASAMPVLHVLYSEAHAGVSRQSDTVVQFDRGALREMNARTASAALSSTSVAAR